MSLPDLRREYRHAYKMAILTRQQGWWRAVRRLNSEIMAAVANGAALGSVKVRQDSIIRGSARASHPSRTALRDGAQ